MPAKRNKVLIVDDMEINRVILSGVFEDSYRLLSAQDGVEAMEHLDTHHDSIAVVLLDLIMPRMDGYQVLREMAEKGYLTKIPVVVITSDDSSAIEMRSFDLGATDIIVKPFEPHVVRRRVQNVVDLYRHKLYLEDLVQEQARSLRESNEVMIDALSSIIEYRNLESGQHILRIRTFTKILLQDVLVTYPEYNMEENRVDVIASASSMHDIGKIAIPDAILNKPGKLMPAEFEVMKTHTTKGCQILEGFGRMNDKVYLQYAYNITRYHHERWDGKGYPDGLRGDNIPLCAQVVGIADAYDALTTDRVYKGAFSHEKAMNMILNGECGAFNPKLLESFKHVSVQFANLAREYADGRSPHADTFISSPPQDTSLTDLADIAQMGQMKYFTILKYLDSTVIEADLDTGIFHIVYAPNADFEVLHCDSIFEEAFHSFIHTRVHPSDRKRVLDCMTDCMRAIFDEGIMSQSKDYRILGHASGEYKWYCSTILRINTENPKQHKALIVWKELGTDSPE